ncbi:MAG: CDP-diacylglycerol--glycerol-3-phosphate 3-phosphatidyltransferase [Deltaproteobacteria bacterium CG_4_10_14_3_um_filter_60_8]|nr:MAG: CDP-diacylglycerol--glycerol-3-phosphate 3-phosphatidyltransferase [Desulfobacterales bacterium CG2_30_60_27]PIP43796.1 MAG: CDP-diacylglycerol--glycerol-3-phosphate 3-phosphatidyltransferase [Deltaproteobacteria bacterium CG23_combo_of_CG06-09_8_20_14_all_60_8]PIY23153.1 MAG: CDP-diacylglycerol--glycerol-3-phosphate 3-phosphatidyltransferase [Deltaproteobacteria bacterium CG_4_10_14_3_um_filter_60_8]
MNIPNIISMLRILLVPLLVIFLLQGKIHFALLVFLLAGLSDAVDGFLARLLHQQTSIGAFIDPLADKLLINTAFVTLGILGIMPGWLAVLVVSRDIIILAGILVLMLTGDRTMEIRPTLDSKINTVTQLGCVCFFLAFDLLGPIQAWEQAILLVTAFFTMVSGFRYIVIGFRILGKTKDGE